MLRWKLPFSDGVALVTLHECAIWVLVLKQNNHCLDNWLEYPLFILIPGYKIRSRNYGFCHRSITCYLPYRMCEEGCLDAKLHSASIMIPGRIWRTFNSLSLHRSVVKWSAGKVWDQFVIPWVEARICFGYQGIGEQVDKVNSSRFPLFHVFAPSWKSVPIRRQWPVWWCIWEERCEGVGKLDCKSCSFLGNELFAKLFWPDEGTMGGEIDISQSYRTIW